MLIIYVFTIFKNRSSKEIVRNLFFVFFSCIFLHCQIKKATYDKGSSESTIDYENTEKSSVSKFGKKNRKDLKNFSSLQNSESEKENPLIILKDAGDEKVKNNNKKGNVAVRKNEAISRDNIVTGNNNGENNLIGADIETPRNNTTHNIRGNNDVTIEKEKNQTDNAVITDSTGSNNNVTFEKEENQANNTNIRYNTGGNINNVTIEKEKNQTDNTNMRYDIGSNSNIAYKYKNKKKPRSNVVIKVKIQNNSMDADKKNQDNNAIIKDNIEKNNAIDTDEGYGNINSPEKPVNSKFDKRDRKGPPNVMIPDHIGEENKEEELFSSSEREQLPDWANLDFCMNNSDIFNDDDLDSLMNEYTNLMKENLKHSRNKNSLDSQSSKMSANECFSILGLNSSVSINEIKKKYKQLARKYHPDKNSNNGSSQFTKISEAYQTLKILKNFN